MKKESRGHSRQEQERRREGLEPHLHYTVGTLQSVDTVVGDSDSFCQTLLVTLDQTLAEGIICP